MDGVGLLVRDDGVIARETARMRAAPVGLERPVVILKGWRAFDSNARVLRDRLRRLIEPGSGMIRHYNYGSTLGIARIARRVAAEVRADFPGCGEFDVIGVSMGGLLGRWIAMEGLLRVERLFTVVTPHGGAQLATFTFPLDVSTMNMRAGSALLGELDEALEDESRRPGRIVTYTRTRDVWVGSRNTVIRGPGECVEGRVVRTPRFGLAHLRATGDPLIAVDIARRLRGEAPLEVAS